MPLATIIETEFPSAPNAAEVCTLAAQARKAVLSARTAAVDALQAERDAKAKADMHAEFVADADDIRKQDTDKLAHMRNELINARDSVGSDAAKAAFVAAHKQLDVDAQVNAELACHNAALSAARVAAARAHITAVRLQGALARLEFTAVLEAYPSDVSSRAVLALVARELRSTAFGQAKSVEEFFAFRGAHTMPEVGAALAKPLHRIGTIEVGEPALVAWLPQMESKTAMASLSACGVLCMGGKIDTGALTVVHLLSKRSVVISCERDWVHGFVHAGELFVAQREHDTLWHAPVAEVLAGRTDLAEFETFPLAARWGSTPRLDAAPAGWVAVKNNDIPTQHMVVDLAARTSRLVEVGQDLQILGGFTGIAAPDAAWAATTSNPSSPVLVVAPDGTTRNIADEMYPFPTVLPSAAAPADLARAAVLDGHAKLSVGGAHEQLEDPAKPYGQSLVRLFQDAFLFWDAKRKVWAIARIVVP